MIGVRMRLALKWCQQWFRTFLFLHHTPPYIATVHTCLFAFAVNRNDLRMHSTFGLVIIHACANRFAVSLQG